MSSFLLKKIEGLHGKVHRITEVAEVICPCAAVSLFLITSCYVTPQHASIPQRAPKRLFPCTGAGLCFGSRHAENTKTQHEEMRLGNNRANLNFQTTPPQQ